MIEFVSFRLRISFFRVGIREKPDNAVICGHPNEIDAPPMFDSPTQFTVPLMHCVSFVVPFCGMTTIHSCFDGVSTMSINHHYLMLKQWHPANKANLTKKYEKEQEVTDMQSGSWT